MQRAIILLVLVFSIVTLSHADNDIDKRLYKQPKSSLTAEQYVNSINKAENALYDSVNIWWLGESKISDSIRNIDYPIYPEDVYNQRINYLNELTPIKLEYNEHVQKYIKAYGLQNRAKLQLIIAKSSYYFPIFEECLLKYGLPLELKYLAAVESALDPNAISTSGAVGLWQFMKPTSDIFDIKVSSYIDERRDVYKSTDAACRYLKYLFNMFGDWQVALAAYNGGPGTVRKAIARSGGKTSYWELRPYFTNQMQNYVPAFIAMNYLMNYHAEHNIFPDNYLIEALKTDTLEVLGPLKLKQIADFTCYDYETIKQLNPVYVYAYIPADGETHTLVLPNTITNSFLENSDEIYNQIEIDTISNDTIIASLDVIRPERNDTAYHEIIAGDNLFRLSMKYNCSIQEIKKWNALGEAYILHIGHKLVFLVE